MEVICSGAIIRHNISSQMLAGDTYRIGWWGKNHIIMITKRRSDPLSLWRWLMLKKDAVSLRWSRKRRTIQPGSRFVPRKEVRRISCWLAKSSIRPNWIESKFDLPNFQRFDFFLFLFALTNDFIKINEIILLFRSKII